MRYLRKNITAERAKYRNGHHLLKIQGRVKSFLSLFWHGVLSFRCHKQYNIHYAYRIYPMGRSWSWCLHTTFSQKTKLTGFLKVLNLGKIRFKKGKVPRIHKKQSTACARRSFSKYRLLGACKIDLYIVVAFVNGDYSELMYIYRRTKTYN